MIRQSDRGARSLVRLSGQANLPRLIVNMPRNSGHVLAVCGVRVTGCRRHREAALALTRTPRTAIVAGAGAYGIGARNDPKPELWVLLQSTLFRVSERECAANIGILLILIDLFGRSKSLREGKPDEREFRGRMGAWVDPWVTHVQLDQVDYSLYIRLMF